MRIEIGVEHDDRQSIVRGLSRVLADTYTLHLEADAFHWNVTGPMSHSLRSLFEKQSHDLSVGANRLAERIRTLGFKAPGTFREFSELSTIEAQHASPDAREMIRLLAEGHATVARTARLVFKTAETIGDQPTCELLTHRMESHEKAASVLSTLLE